MYGRKKIFWGTLFFIECLFILGCYWFYKKEGIHMTFQASDFQSEGVFFEEFLDTGLEGYYIDSSFPATPEFVRTETTDLPPGCYQITMHYAAEGGPQEYTMDGENIDFHILRGNWKTDLPSGEDSYTSLIWNDRLLKDFNIIFDYSGDGYLLVGKVEIVERKEWVVGFAVLSLLVFILADMAIWKREKIRLYCAEKENRMIWAGCAFIILFASLPLFAPAIFRGHDLEFHLLRIEGIKEGLQSGQFPVKIHPNWMNGYGYGVSAFYGDFFLYFPALLRLCNIGIQAAYKAYVFMVNVLTCLFSYYAFRRFCGDSRIGLIGSFLYTCSVYRLVCIYIRAAVGEYSAMVFLPLFFVGIYEILFKEEEKKGIKGWMLAALSYTGIIYCHMITSEMTALFAIFAGLIFWRYTFRRSRIIRIVKCGLSILAASAAFLVPFLDMSRDSYWFNGEETINTIQSYGASWNQLFSLFPNGSGEALSFAVVDRVTVGGEMPYALGGGFLAAAGIFLAYYIYNGGKEEQVKFARNLLIFAILTAWMTTSSFPWNLLQAVVGPLKFMIYNIQFPWRILGISTVAFTCFACIAIDLFRKWKRYGVAAVMLVLVFALVSSGYLLSDRMTDNYVWCIRNEDSLNDFGYMGGEYIPENGEKANKDEKEPVCPEEMEISGYERNYHRFRLTCVNHGEKDGYVDLPLLYYRGYAAKDAASGNKMEVVKSEEAKVRIRVPAGYTGEICLEYREYWYWRAAELISLFYFLGLAGIGAGRIFGHKRLTKRTDRL